MNVARQISNALRILGPPLAGLLEDIALLGGAALVSYGVWEVHRPAGHITAGALLIVGSILKARGAV